MAAQLPAFPRLIFTIIEPLSLVAGFLGPIVDPTYFVSSQLPSVYNGKPDATTKLIAWQLGNAYLLLGLLGTFILNTTSELKVVKAYLFALLLGDVGHAIVTVLAMGWESTLDVGQWNAVVWGNVGASIFLFTTRSAYFAGLFGSGPSAVRLEAKKK